MSFDFGIPKRDITKKDEKYPFPVLTLQPRPDGENRTYRFKFNKAGLEALKIEGKDNYVAFVFLGEHSFISNVTDQADNLPSNVTCKVTLNGEFSSKNYFEYIAKKASLDTTQENDFQLEKEEREDTVLFRLEIIEKVGIEIESVESEIESVEIPIGELIEEQINGI